MANKDTCVSLPLKLHTVGLEHLDVVKAFPTIDPNVVHGYKCQMQTKNLLD